MHRLLLIAAIIPAFFTADARADTPAWTDDPGFQGLCNEMRREAGCVVCRCDAWTQTPPGPLKHTGVDLEAGVLVHIEGKTASGATVNQLRVVLGDAKLFSDAGAVLIGGSHSKLSYKLTLQFQDMCPGTCEHKPVEAVHLFELTSTTKRDLADGARTVTKSTQLTACFKGVGKGAKPACWSVPLGETVRRFETKTSTKATVSMWNRSWSMGGKSSMQVVFTAPTPSASAPAAVKASPRASYFHVFSQRPDVIGGGGTAKAVKLSLLRGGKHTVAIGQTLEFGYKSHASVGFTGTCSTNRARVVAVTSNTQRLDVPVKKYPNGVRPSGGDKGKGLVVLTAKAKGKAKIKCRTQFRGTTKNEATFEVTVK